MSLPGDVGLEILHHLAFAYAKCGTFVGREPLIKAVIAAIDSVQCVSFFRHAGICVYLVGVSGAGKTALMAKVASEMFSRCGDRFPVLIRFCGTSPGSRNARSLMLSLCDQIEFLFDLKERQSTLLVDKDYKTLVSYFQSLLQTHPMIVFIDSLDQLSNDDLGRSDISFLKNVQPHADTRIIVSCLPDELEVNAETGKRYLYLCETRLRE